MDQLARLASAYIVILCMMESQCAVGSPLRMSMREFMMSPAGQKICGPTLTTIIMDICSSIRKKSQEDEQYNWEMPDETSTFPFRSSRFSRNLQMVRVRRQAIEGLADECCKKPCTYDQIKEYC